MVLNIDILGMELANNSPYWLAKPAKSLRHGPNINAIRARHRAKHLKHRKHLKHFKRRAALHLMGRR